MSTTVELLTWSDIARRLGGVSVGSLYAICRRHPEAKPKAHTASGRELYFSEQEAQRFVDWYHKNHRGGSATRVGNVDVSSLDPDEVLEGYEALYDYSMEKTNGQFGITLNGIGHWQRKYGELKPNFYKPGEKSGRWKACFLKSSVDQFLAKRETPKPVERKPEKRQPQKTRRREWEEDIKRFWADLPKPPPPSTLADEFLQWYFPNK